MKKHTDKAKYQIHLRLNSIEYQMLQDINKKLEENICLSTQNKINKIDGLKQGLYYAHMIMCDEKYIILENKTYKELTKKNK